MSSAHFGAGFPDQTDLTQVLGEAEERESYEQGH